MKKYAVGYYSLFDNELIIEIVEANSIEEAASKHSKIDADTITNISKEHGVVTLEFLKDEFFNWDSAIDVVEII